MEWLIVALLMALLLWAVVAYNLLVRDRNRVDAAWSDIDVQLKRRYDLLPKLVAAVSQYAAYERATLATITELRSSGESPTSVAGRAAVEDALGGSVHKLIALAESYPELKADRSFLELQTQISAVEDHIQHARRYYNGAVRNLNTRIDTFPDLLLARLFAYRHREYFDYEPT